jgi:hypothetical protein
MAGTLVISTLSDGTNSTSATNVTRSPILAWMYYNGISGSQSLIRSYNVSSVTYNSTGNYTANFTSSLPATSYAFVGGAQANTSSPSDTLSCSMVNGTNLTTSVRMTTGIGGSGVRDAGGVYFAIIYS